MQEEQNRGHAKTNSDSRYVISVKHVLGESMSYVHIKKSEKKNLDNFLDFSYVHLKKSEKKSRFFWIFFCIFFWIFFGYFLDIFFHFYYIKKSGFFFIFFLEKISKKKIQIFLRSKNGKKYPEKIKKKYPNFFRIFLDGRSFYLIGVF